MSRSKIREKLVESGVVPEEGRAAILEAQTGSDGRFLSVALEQNLAPERDLAQALAEQLGAPCLVFDESVLNLEALDLIPKVVAEEHQVLGVDIDEDTIWVVTPDADDREIFSQIAFASGRRVQPLVGLSHRVTSMLEACYSALRQNRRLWAGDKVEQDRASQGHLAIARGLVTDDIEILDTTDPQIPAQTIADSTADVEAVVTQSPEGRLVLVVEDDESVQDILARILRKDGFQPHIAGDGRSAFAFLREHRPELVLLDAMLPEIHGFEICATLKSSEEWADIPVLMMSAVYRGWEHARNIQEVHGADAFVEKPFDLNYLRELVARLVGRVTQKPSLSMDRQQELSEVRRTAQSAYKSKSWDEALPALERWRHIDPFDPMSYLMRGNIEFRQGELASAMTQFERAATFGPESFPAFRNLAVVYEKLGFRKRAMMSWTRAQQLSSDEKTSSQIGARLQKMVVPR